MSENEYFLPPEKDWEEIAGLTWDEFLASEARYTKRWGLLLRWDSLAQLLKETPSPVRRERILSVLKVHQSEVRWEEAFNRTAIEKEHLELHEMPELKAKLFKATSGRTAAATKAREGLKEMPTKVIAFVLDLAKKAGVKSEYHAVKIWLKRQYGNNPRIHIMEEQRVTLVFEDNNGNGVELPHQRNKKRTVTHDFVLAFQVEPGPFGKISSWQIQNALKPRGISTNSKPISTK